MLPLHAVVVAASTIGLVGAESACGPVPTVTVTVHASPAPKLGLDAASLSRSRSATSNVPLNAAPFVDTPTYVTATLSSTSFLTNTKVVGAADSPVWVTPQDGNYYYAEDDGTTIWLGGKTPTSGAELVTNTKVVIIQPQPVTTGPPIVPTVSEAASRPEDGTSTSFATVWSTSFYTTYLTKALTLEAASTSLPAAKLTPYLGQYGWNATFATLQRLKSGTAPVKSSDAGVEPTATWNSVSKVTSDASLTAKRKHPRQIGAIVTATIDGVIVSWTNTYGGGPVTPTPVANLETSSGSLAVPTAKPSIRDQYVWQSSPVSSTNGVAPPESSAQSEYSWASSLAPSTSAITQPAISTVQQSSAQSSVIPGFPASTSIKSIPESDPLSAPKEPSPTQMSNETSFSTVSLIKPSKPTSPFLNATQTSSKVSATTTSCGSDTGRFTINFDDLPHFSAGPNDTDIPPIFNPYRKLFFNAGYGYVPPPSDPYAPISPPQLAVWNNYNDSFIQHSIDAGLELKGEIGAGPRVNESAYWIDAYSAWIGCANSGPDECRLDFIGFDAFDTQIATQTLLQPPCPDLVNCQLTQVTFTSQFRDLAGLQILAYVNKTPVTFYMDDLSLGWSNNTCAAQLQRSSAE
ncbi:MAG: hypothetical protein Q9201_002901 [Fulgogasparrea decipioides]